MVFYFDSVGSLFVLFCLVFCKRWSGEASTGFGGESGGRVLAEDGERVRPNYCGPAKVPSSIKSNKNSIKNMYIRLVLFSVHSAVPSAHRKRTKQNLVDQFFFFFFFAKAKAKAKPKPKPKLKPKPTQNQSCRSINSGVGSLAGRF